MEASPRLECGVARHAAPARHNRFNIVNSHAGGQEVPAGCKSTLCGGGIAEARAAPGISSLTRTPSCRISASRRGRRVDRSLLREPSRASGATRAQRASARRRAAVTGRVSRARRRLLRERGRREPHATPVVGSTARARAAGSPRRELRERGGCANGVVGVVHPRGCASRGVATSMRTDSRRGLSKTGLRLARPSRGRTSHGLRLGHADRDGRGRCGTFVS